MPDRPAHSPPRDDRRDLARRGPPAGAPLEVIETHNALMHLALHARERLLDDAPAGLDDDAAALLRADLHCYRALLRIHAHTPSGHCQTCRFPDDYYYPRRAWPCPTVTTIYQALTGTTPTTATQPQPPRRVARQQAAPPV